MNKKLLRMVVILGLLLVFGGVTIAMAKADQPAGPNFDMNLANVQVQPEPMNDPAQIASKHLVMAENRLQEINRMALAGDVPDQGTLLRLEEHFNLALKLAAQLNNEGMMGIINQAEQMVQNQIREMTQTQAKVGEHLQEPLRVALRIMNRVQEQVQAAKQDPEGFRYQYQHQSRLNQTVEGWLDEGLLTLEDCNPVGDENKYGQDGSQPGPQYRNQDCEDCIPPGDEHKYGQDDSQPGDQDRDRDQDQDQDCQDCVPQGDENKNGQDNGKSGSKKP
jgi:hypothetical protein